MREGGRGVRDRSGRPADMVSLLSTLALPLSVDDRMSRKDKLRRAHRGCKGGETKRKRLRWAGIRRGEVDEPRASERVAESISVTSGRWIYGG